MTVYVEKLRGRPRGHVHVDVRPRGHAATSQVAYATSQVAYMYCSLLIGLLMGWLYMYAENSNCFILKPPILKPSTWTAETANSETANSATANSETASSATANSETANSETVHVDTEKFSVHACGHMMYIQLGWSLQRAMHVRTCMHVLVHVLIGMIRCGFTIS